MIGCMGTNVKINLWYARCSCPAGKWRCNIPALDAKGLFQVLSASDIDMSTCRKDNPCALCSCCGDIASHSTCADSASEKCASVVKIGYT